MAIPQAETTSVSFRIDKDLKKAADELFNSLGMNMTTAFNVFLRQSIREGGIPFEIKHREPSRHLIEAMLEAEAIARDPNAESFATAADLFAEILK